MANPLSKADMPLEPSASTDKGLVYPYPIKFNELARQTDLAYPEKFNINGRWAINTYETVFLKTTTDHRL